MSRNEEHRGAFFGGAPNGRPPSAADPLGLCSLFLLIYLSILFIFIDIPYIFLMYFIFICPFFLSRRGSPACITPRGNCATSPVDARKQSNRQRIALLGYTVQYNQVAGGCPKAIHRNVPGIPQPYGLTAPLRGPRGATPETRPPGPPCWPPTPDQTVRGF